MQIKDVCLGMEDCLLNRCDHGGEIIDVTGYFHMYIHPNDEVEYIIRPWQDVIASDETCAILKLVNDKCKIWVLAEWITDTGEVTTLSFCDAMDYNLGVLNEIKENGHSEKHLQSLSFDSLVGV